MTADSNFLLWGAPMGDSQSEPISLFLDYMSGMRWEPAENAGTGRSWVPRDDSAWPLSFAYKYSGSVPASPSDEKYQRYLLSDDDTAADPPVVVLADLELACLDRTSWAPGQSFARARNLCMFHANALTAPR